MQFPESWLRQFIDPPLSTQALCDLLTMAGLEVEEVRPAGGDFRGVVAARVAAVEPHPNADKLRLCRVDCGDGELLQIVCGAANVRADMKVACARVGAQLPEMQIAAAKMRGVDSFGMLCSARELGLGDDHDGLLALPDDAVPGADVRAIVAADDALITIKLTPNRADCLSLLGVAREVAALTGAPLRQPPQEETTLTIDATRRIHLDAADACPRYCGRIVRGVNAAAASPAWLRQRLQHCGVRPVSAAVDVTNYVMLELGQPLHAFDDALLVGDMHVRYPRAGESLLLLNGEDITPGADTALIADDEKALAVAGVMGGEHSGVSDATTDIFLESAFFAPAAIAGKARTMGFASDASHRFERGVDFTLQRRALERATALLIDICGGAAGPVVEAVVAERLPQRTPLRLRSQRAAQALGVALDDEAVGRHIDALGMTRRSDGDAFVVTPPPYRFDIAIEADLIEEIARLHGYDNIPAAPPMARAAMPPASESSRSAMDVRRMMAACGYFEVINYSFVAAALERDFAANTTPVRLANPIASHMDVMRSSLLGGLVGALQGNLKRQAERVFIFEIGRCFVADAAESTGYRQPLRLAALAAGPAAPEQWGEQGRDVDFFDIKGDLETLFAPRQLRWERAEHPALHPGRSASVLLDGVLIGHVGEAHPRWRQQYELSLPTVMFEIDLAPLLAPPLPVSRELSRFPAVVRDIALLAPRACAVQDMLDALRAAAPAHVSEIRLFDVYQGDGVPADSKSLAFRIVMQDTRKTLADNEADAAVQCLVREAAERFGAQLRV